MGFPGFSVIEITNMENFQIWRLTNTFLPHCMQLYDLCSYLNTLHCWKASMEFFRSLFQDWCLGWQTPSSVVFVLSFSRFCWYDQGNYAVFQTGLFQPVTSGLFIILCVPADVLRDDFSFLLFFTRCLSTSNI